MSGVHDFIIQIPGGFEWVILIIVIVVVFFGIKKIPEIAKSFGRAGAEYEKARIQAKRELQQIKSKENEKVGREKLEEIADTLGIDYTNKDDEDLRKAIESAVNKEKDAE